MQKDSNNNIYGWPDYLCRFKYRDESLPKKISKLVLAGKFDYKAENEMLEDFIKQKHKWEHCGGPLTQEVLDQYPGAKKYIKHLRERFGLNYRVWVPPNQSQNDSQSMLAMYMQKKKTQ